MSDVRSLSRRLRCHAKPTSCGRSAVGSLRASLAKQAQEPVKVVPSVRDDVKRLLPGMGEPTAIRIEAEDRSHGRTLKELNLRGLTGATVIAIDRGEQDIVFPRADEMLMPGDILVLTGTEESVALAREVLTGRDETETE
jgi:uncharacterized protein with PhoU and TrkA domain